MSFLPVERTLPWLPDFRERHCDPDKTRCIVNWPTPTSVKEVRQFLGLSSYYRKFIKSFAQIAAPLFQLTELKRPWCWSEECEESFRSLKESLTRPPVLGFPQFHLPFTLDVDASNEGVGAVLSQIDPDNQQESVIAYASRVLTKQERKYCTTRRELLALVWGIRYFRPYLFGNSFLARTDHRSLNWLKSFKEPECQLARWLQVLEQYDFEVLHRPGAKHLKADALSREPCRQCGHDEVPYSTCANTQVWLPQWSRQELAEAQAQDSEVISWITTRSWPVDFPSRYSHHIQALWAQRHSLVMSEGVLNRKWEDVMNNGAEQHTASCIAKAVEKPYFAPSS